MLDEDDVRETLKRAIEKAGGIGAWSELPGHPCAGYTQAFLYRNGPLGPKILSSLGLEKIVAYRKLR